MPAAEAAQLGLFTAEDDRDLPPGLVYRPDLLPRDDETRLLDRIRDLPFKAFEFHGFTGNRRTVSYGWHYDFGRQNLVKVADIPDFLLPARDLAAELAGLSPVELEHALVIDYPPGAGIGWHRDKAAFGDVIGISLRAPCRFRLRRKIGTSWQRATFTAAPRSAYLLRGQARTEWEHSISPMETLRYSITFRSLRGS